MDSLKRRDITSEKGFTLIEILIAMTIAMIGLAGLLSLHGTVMSGSRNVSLFKEARSLGEEAMEDHRTISIPQLESLHGAVPITVNLSSVNGRTGQVYVRQLDVQILDDDLVRMIIHINWTEKGATPGSEGGKYDHQVNVELLRDRQEVL